MIDDQKFGLPKLKKYPMPDADHVRSAIKFFNYVSPANEEELAKAILSRMKEYGISPESLNVGEENRFKKYVKDTELKHHGILGMHWGVRRFQNPDGTRTAAGKRRQREDNKSTSDSSSSKGMSDTTKYRIKTGAKIAAGIAVAGVAAYGLHKMGVVQNGKNVAKSILSSNTTVPISKANSSKPASSAARYISKRSTASKPSAATRSIIAANKSAKANFAKSRQTGSKFVYAQPSSSLQQSIASLNKSTQSTIDFTTSLLQQFS